MSGGWQRTFHVSHAGQVATSFWYNLTQSPHYESDERSEMLVSVDGVLVGRLGQTYVDQITGNGNGGPERSTGWQQALLDLGELSAGNHTVTLGAYNNKKNTADESTKVLVDRLRIVQASAGPASDCGTLPQWQVGSYEGGDHVRHGSTEYECKPYPYSGWCGQLGYEPGVAPSWPDAWILIGPCQ
jgi:hypothetical protein